MPLSVTIFGDPVPKARPRFSSKGGFRTYTPQKTKDYEKLIQKHLEGLIPNTIMQNMHLHVEAVFSRPKSMRSKKYPTGLIHKHTRPDIDNVIKAVMDALNVFIKDDSLIVSISAEKFYAELDGNPRTTITLSVLSQEGET